MINERPNSTFRGTMLSREKNSMNPEVFRLSKIDQIGNSHNKVKTNGRKYQQNIAALFLHKLHEFCSGRGSYYKTIHNCFSFTSLMNDLGLDFFNNLTQ